jgi:hypothetical protein
MSFGASQDTYVDEGNPGTAHGADQDFVVDGEAVKRNRALLLFDISSLPANATIVTAELHVCLIDTTSNSEGRTHELRRVTSAWTNAVVWTNQPTVAGTSTDSFVVPANNNDCVVLDVAADVQGWVDGTTNFGWRLSDANETIPGPADATYESMESVTSSVRPQLVVVYSP